MIEALKKHSLNQFTKAEFTDFVHYVAEFEERTEEEDNEIFGRFIALCPHPAKGDLIFWPEEGADDSPEGVVTEIERYCRENGLPGFKDSDF